MQFNKNKQKLSFLKKMLKYDDFSKNVTDMYMYAYMYIYIYMS